MPETQRREEPDRRQVHRGGRRPYDQPGCHPPILFADSCEGARRPCTSYLRRLNFDVAEAASREDMAARLSETMPRLVVAEWGLPGDQASKQWFDMLRWSDVPVILIANTEDETQPLPEGAAGVLKKPFSLSDMIAEVRRVLRETDRFSVIQDVRRI